MYMSAQPYASQFAGLAPVAVDMRYSYDRYFSTGLYASRYPVPNPHLLNLILAEIGPAGGRVLDFGCGNGRYALALARRPGMQVFGYDISEEAVRELGRRYEEMASAGVAASPLEMLSGDLEELERRLDDSAGFDIVMLMFGVLGHIPQRGKRVAVLRSLCRRLRPGGRLIASVPNRARRFLTEQAAARHFIDRGMLEPGDIYYKRIAGAAEIDLYYHLYSPAEFCAELAEGGFAVGRLRAESVLSERMVLASAVGAGLDRLLRKVTPVSLAYGMVAVARPMAAP